MSQRPSDTMLASNFTQTKHGKPTAALDPQTNKLPRPLNVLIIGGSRGIGEGIVYAYAQASASTLLLAARSSSAQELSAVEQRARQLNPSISTKCLAVDITSSESVALLAQRVKQELGPRPLDIVVLNSGYSGPVVLKVSDGDPQDFEDVFNVNVQGTYHVAHHFIPLLNESNGAKTFIVVNSFAACIINGHIANTAYCVSKFAQARLVEFISEQFGNEGVLAVAVHPGAVNTEQADRTTPESFRPYLTDNVGLCGAFCVWLSREKRMWLNGRLVSATWDVDELVGKKGEIEGGDLLKFGFRVGDMAAGETAGS